MAEFLVFLFEHSDFAVGLSFEVEQLMLRDPRCSRRVKKPSDRQDLDFIKQVVVLELQQLNVAVKVA